MDHSLIRLLVHYTGNDALRNYTWRDLAEEVRGNLCFKGGAQTSGPKNQQPFVRCEVIDETTYLSITYLTPLSTGSRHETFPATESAQPYLQGTELEGNHLNVWDGFDYIVHVPYLLAASNKYATAGSGWDQIVFVTEAELATDERGFWCPPDGCTKYPKVSVVYDKHQDGDLITLRVSGAVPPDVLIKALRRMVPVTTFQVKDGNPRQIFGLIVVKPL